MLPSHFYQCSREMLHIPLTPLPSLMHQRLSDVAASCERAGESSQRSTNTPLMQSSEQSPPTNPPTDAPCHLPSTGTPFREASPAHRHHQPRRTRWSSVGGGSVVVLQSQSCTLDCTTLIPHRHPPFTSAAPSLPRSCEHRLLTSFLLRPPNECDPNRPGYLTPPPSK